MREVKATVEQKKPLVLVHEADTNKGGHSMDEVKKECPATHRDAIFLEHARHRGAVVSLLGDDGRDDAIQPEGVMERQATVWHRIKDFQIASLLEIAEGVLAKLPDGPPWSLEHAASPLYLPGSILEQHFEFAKQVVLYASDNNPGALEAATELCGFFEDRNIRVTNMSPQHQACREASEGATASEVQVLQATASECAGTPSGHDSRQRVLSVEAVTMEARDMEAPPSGERATHFLLYLSEHTFVGEDGQRLADEVRAARVANMDIAMVHENDPALNGCEFGRSRSCAVYLRAR